jgi:O-antigen ligase
MKVNTRWQQALLFFSFIAVLFTTLFSWFNINSLCIILLLLSRLLYKPLSALKTAFRNPIFLAYFVFCVVEAAGYLHTHNFADQGKTVSKEATLVAIAFVFCAGNIPDARAFRRLLGWYYVLLLAASVYCLVVAWRNYAVTNDASVFFYHSLTRPISQNAVFFCLYVVFGSIFLLAPYGQPFADYLPIRARRILRVLLVVFFLGMIVLLNSKLLLVIALLILIHAFLRRYSYRQHKRVVLVTVSVLLVAAGVLLLTDNPVSARYKDMAGDLAVVRQKEFNRAMYFNPLQLRLLEFRFASEILHEHRAWLFGVSPGDSQDLLDQKYVETNMYIGNPADGPHRHIRGFIGYNFHNQYLETFVRSGLVGLAALLAIFGTLFAAARRQGCRETWFVILTIAVFFIPEAPLTLQHGVFLFCFFPLLALSAARGGGQVTGIGNC